MRFGKPGVIQRHRVIYFSGLSRVTGHLTRQWSNAEKRQWPGLWTRRGKYTISPAGVGVTSISMPLGASKPELLLAAYQDKLAASTLGKAERKAYLAELKAGLQGYTYLED